MTAFTFHKTERLCSKILISKLFEKGNHYLNRFPFRFSWVEADHDGTFPVQVIFIVSKKNFPKAHDRNKVKRQIREFYRLNKHKLYKQLAEKKFVLQIAYTGKALIKSSELEPLFVKAFQELITHV